MKRGVTLIELLISVAIISILASMTLPVTKTLIIRSREYELKRNLMTIRGAIDKFKKDFDSSAGSEEEIEEVNVEESQGDKKTEDKFAEIRDGIENGYPPSLETLVGYRYLRRVPSDPFSLKKPEDENSNWGIISFTDKGGDVYDVYSKSSQISLEGSKYKEW